MYTKEDHEKKVKEFVSICKETADLYAAKNWDYGDSFGKSFEEWGMPMPCIRLTDKLNRLCSLTKNSSQRVQDESIEDTLKDLATYSVMTLIELRRLKGLPSAPSKDVLRG